MVRDILYFLVIKISTQKAYYKDMEIRENNNICIYAPLNSQLGEYESERLLKEISKDNREIAIDLQYVENCSIDFIEAIKKISNSKKIGIFNISSDIFTLLNIMNIDKISRLFVCELDFVENKRQLINRKLSLV